ncbi:uncharacterized protein LTR77_004540 [Saxophila tyrrhenica]|uniref:Uncharacterized protein n=1 Tax=Saxophila tyrrhenica TaxID=1690608 RepID=A0AAV9PDV8_9PEZI|nr:hypothetical protein LTR77_004540 [Saxophila tyrrhenica]
MQFLTLAALFGSALAADGLLGPRAVQPFCSSINSCVTTNGNPASATAFCASYNSIATVTSGTTTTTVQPSDCGSVTKRADAPPVVNVLAPSKARCFKKLLDGRLSKACDCLSIPTATVAESTMTETAVCSVTSL